MVQTKPGAFIINAGRGALVNTEHLEAALRAGRIQAALDVTDPEPLPHGHSLWSVSYAHGRLFNMCPSICAHFVTCRMNDANAVLHRISTYCCVWIPIVAMSLIFRFPLPSSVGAAAARSCRTHYGHLVSRCATAEPARLAVLPITSFRYATHNLACVLPSQTHICIAYELHRIVAMQAPNVTITPHIACIWDGGIQSVAELVKAQIGRWSTGQPLLNVATDGY